MQQQYANGMMPMMMPMMDPRLMPVMDPRMMPQPMMMMDPRFMTGMAPMVSPPNQLWYPPQGGDASSVGSNGRQKHKRHMSSSGSIATSINSNTNSRYSPTARRTKNN